MKALIEIDEVLAAKVFNECVVRSVEFEAFVVGALRDALDEPGDSTTRDFDMAGIVAKAVERASVLASESIFHIDSVCPSDEWKALNAGERKIFGKAFRKAVEGSTPQIAVHVGRTSGNKAIYQRI
jgi:Arc/MetJ family transcription regulator